MCFNGLMMSWQNSQLVPGGLTVPAEYTHTHSDINSRLFHNFLHAVASVHLVQKRNKPRPDVAILFWLLHVENSSS